MDFTFLAVKIMRFFGWTIAELNATPMSAFWTCLKYMDRVRADESLARIPEGLYATCDESGRKQILSSLQRARGNVIVEKEIFDHEGWENLKDLV